MNLSLMPHQVDFVVNDTHRFVGFVGGYGVGKSRALCARALMSAKRNPGCLGALMEPTFAMTETDLKPTWEEMLDESGIRWEYESKSYLIYKLWFPGQLPSRVQLMSAENHNRLRGKNLAWWGVDEFDTIQPVSLQVAVLEQLLARLRAGFNDKTESGFFVSTPEGFKTMWKFFVDDVEKEKKRCAADGEEYVEDRILYRASTYDNYLLKPSYIESLKKQYPPQLLKAYLNGEFVNLARGTVYDNYKPAYEDGNWTKFTADDFPDHPLHFGCDFNGPKNGGSSAVIYIINDGIWYAVDEFMGQRKTRDMAQAIRNKYPERLIYAHPDKSGGQEGANSEFTNFDHLYEAGFEVYTEDRLGRKKNPDIVDRVNCVNGMLLNGEGERRLFVNPELCPRTDSAFQRQPYNDNGQPLKDNIMDGPMDAAGYAIWNIHATNRSAFRAGSVNG